jgi:hypothetical protein
MTCANCRKPTVTRKPSLPNPKPPKPSNSGSPSIGQPQDVRGKLTSLKYVPK